MEISALRLQAARYLEAALGNVNIMRLQQETSRFMDAGKAEPEEPPLIIKMSTSALLAGVAGLMMMSTPSLATPAGALQLLGSVTLSDGSAVVPVAQKKKRLRNRRRLRRFRTKRRGFNHFRNGFYYARPFWDDEDYYEDDYDFDDGDYDDEPDNARGGGDRHEAWCRRKYRSYRVRTDTWTDYDGNTRQCNSPFN